MFDEPKRILSILDACCDAFTFPMLDNGYVYLAATRLTLFRSQTDWALTVEVFGFSPRSGLPDTSVSTFASGIHNRKTLQDYQDQKAYDNYLANNPNNEMEFIHPVAEGSWLDEELVGEGAVEVFGARRTCSTAKARRVCSPRHRSAGSSRNPCPGTLQIPG